MPAWQLPGPRAGDDFLGVKNFIGILTIQQSIHCLSHGVGEDDNGDGELVIGSDVSEEATAFQD